MSIAEDIERLICEVERRAPLYNKKLKEYSDRNLKDKLWYEVCKSVVMNWSELPTQQKSEKRVEHFRYLGTNLTNQNSFQEGNVQIEVTECLLLLGAESFVFQFAVQEHKD